MMKQIRMSRPLMLYLVFMLLSFALFPIFAISAKPKDYPMSVPMGVFLVLLFCIPFGYIVTLPWLLLGFACVSILISRLAEKGGKHDGAAKKKRALLYLSLVSYIIGWLIVIFVGFAMEDPVIIQRQRTFLQRQGQTFHDPYKGIHLQSHT